METIALCIECKEHENELGETKFQRDGGRFTEKSNRK